MLNSCILVGNLGKDPEIFYSQDGDPIATFNLAFSSGKDKTGWIKITAFKKLAEIVEKFLAQGNRIGVAGRLTQNNWETNEGEKRSSIELIANSIEFIKVQKQPQEEENTKEGEQSNDDDLPF